MKLFHLSDLHLGKRVYEYSMLEDQAYILQQVLSLIDSETPDGVLIAGDVYDKAVPPAEAVLLFDGFLSALAAREIPVFVISGNHDSPERIAFGAHIMDKKGVHMSPVFDDTVKPVILEDAYGEVNIYMLPFIKPMHVRQADKNAEISSYTEAIQYAVDKMQVDPSTRNVIVTHQFVTGAKRSESEELSVGGTDNVDAAVFSPFDYVALGHIHSPQNCQSDRIRYCGTPLKYSFSEAKDQKSVTIVELREKGNVSYRTAALTPRHDLIELKGAYETLTQKAFYENTSWQEDYTHITLTDEDDIPDAVGKLRTIYHRLMLLDYDNKRTRLHTVIDGDNDVETKSPFALFADFYEQQNNQPMNEEQTAFMKTLIEKTWEEGQ